MFSDFKGVRGICWKVMGGVYGVPRSKGTFDGSSDMVSHDSYIDLTQGPVTI